MTTPRPRSRVFSRLPLLAVVLTLMMPSAPVASVAAAATPTATDVSARLDRDMRGFVDGIGFGGAVLVARGGRVVLRRAYGSADRVAKAPNTPETAFQIGSLSKAFTGMAIVQLAEAGRLSLDDPITARIPEFPHAERDGVAVTLRQMLAHTSGIPDFLGFHDAGDPAAWPRSFASLRADIEAKPLLFTPGAEYAYSNSAYDLLGVIVERVSGESFEGYLSRRILQPLGMTSSWLFAAPNPAPPVAVGYGKFRGVEIGVSIFSCVDLAFAAGGITSTVDDLLRWDRALLTDRLATRASIAEMLAPGLHGYGLGWQTETISGHRSVGHDGTTIGYRSKLSRFLAADATIIVLANDQRMDVDRVTAGLAATLLRCMAGPS